MGGLYLNTDTDVREVKKYNEKSLTIIIRDLCEHSSS